MKSTVKKYFRDKGYGFLQNGTAADIYVRSEDLSNCGFLRQGVEVEFECHVVNGKLVAKKVRLSHSRATPHIEQPRYVMR